MNFTYPKYDKINQIAHGRTNDVLTEGTLVLEGGAYRALYTQGALDALMQAGLNFRNVIGCSAGALSGIGYVAGEIGWCARINLTYRHDPNYCGAGAMRVDHGITGFTYLFTEITRAMPLDWTRLDRSDRRFLVVATNVRTGKPVYLDRTVCDIRRAAQASATVPYVSEPVKINGELYLDGGCSVHIPYHYAKEHFPGKQIVIKTRDNGFRPRPKELHAIDHLLYDRWPAFQKAQVQSMLDYGTVLDEIDRDAAEGKTFVLAPEKPIHISHFEGNMETLGALYFDGYRETKARIPALLEYIKS